MRSIWPERPALSCNRKGGGFLRVSAAIFHLLTLGLESMSVLGVILDLGTLGVLVMVRFLSGDARRVELNETLSRHLDSYSLTPKEAESLRGQLGRIANLSLHEVGKRATCIGNHNLLTDDLRRALEFLKSDADNQWFANRSKQICR